MKQTLLVLLLSGFCLGWTGCSSESEVTEEPQEMVYFDSAKQEPVVFEAATEFPAVHPETGKQTLMPALYCSRCAAWRPLPPVELINRSPGAGACPKCTTRMETEGPWPAKRLAKQEL